MHPYSCSMRRSRAPGTTPTLGTVALSCACLALAVPSVAFAFNIGPSSVGWVRHQRQHAAAAAASQRAAGSAAFASPTMVAAEPVVGLMKTVTVDLDDRSYPIYIGTGILERYAVITLGWMSRKVPRFSCLVGQALKNILRAARTACL